MSRPFLFYALFMLLLAGVALYGHSNATKLSLPVSGLSLTSVLFLLISILNSGLSSRLAEAPRPYQTLARALRNIQAVITVVLATLFFSYIPSSDARSCLLSTVWQRLFSSHDADSIRRIQDALSCCGYNTVRDRAWPFPDHETSRRCEDMYGRTLACVQPLRIALQRTSALEFGVVLLSGLAMILYILMEEHASSSPNSGLSNRIGYVDRTRTPLLPPRDDESESSAEDANRHDAGTEDANDAGRPWQV